MRGNESEINCQKIKDIEKKKKKKEKPFHLNEKQKYVFNKN